MEYFIELLNETIVDLRQELEDSSDLTCEQIDAELTKAINAIDLAKDYYNA